MSRVYIALLRDRWNLRRAAPHAGTPGLQRILRKIAFRRSREARELAETSQLDPETVEDEPGLQAFSRDIGRANEISTIAACLRSNRKLQIAIERALKSSPPEKVALRLRRMATSATEAAGVLDARLRDIAAQGFSEAPPVVD